MHCCGLMVRMQLCLIISFSSERYELLVLTRHAYRLAQWVVVGQTAKNYPVKCKYDCVFPCVHVCVYMCACVHVCVGDIGQC